MIVASQNQPARLKFFDFMIKLCYALERYRIEQKTKIPLDDKTLIQNFNKEKGFDKNKKITH